MPRNTQKHVTIEKRLLAALEEVNRPNTVCTGDDIPFVMPGLTVDDVGLISLPLGPDQASALIARCRQAPYGKGTETIVDTGVRRTWELDPDAFQLTNPKWKNLLADILAKVESELGFSGSRLKAHLYKLLVYEKGGFFLPHQDGERLQRMVATLVVILPSLHQGGELIVSHEGTEHRFSFPGAASGNELSYAAFYADCRHEVTPVRSGYRLGLIYNLTLAKSGQKPPAAPVIAPAIAAISQILNDWRTDPVPDKMAVLLDHEYTRDGLAPATLKGADRARAQVLFEAARQSGYMAHLALITLWQSGSAEYAEHSYRRRRSRYWDNDEYDDEEPSDYEMGEIFDESVSADHWTDHAGNKVRLGEIDLDETEIAGGRPLGEGEPSEEEFEGFTGNAGMTLDYWYHRAAVVLWPRESHYDILCEVGTEAAIDGLDAMAAAWRENGGEQSGPQWRECRDFVVAIMESWQPGHLGEQWRTEEKEFPRAGFIGLLQKLDDPALVERGLRQVMSGDTQVQVDASFPEFCARHGWPNLAEAIETVFDANSRQTLARNALFLRTLCPDLGSGGEDVDQERLALCHRLADRMVDSLIAMGKNRRDPHWGRERERPALLADLVTALAGIGADGAFARLTEQTLAHEDQYDLTGAHLAAIFALEPWLIRRQPEPDSAIARWLHQCRARLAQIVEKPPRKPADYRRPAKLSCQCDDCLALGRFLEDPQAPVARFPLAKARRQHLHQIIDGNGYDVTHVTERKGRPFTLVCRKTTASYNAAHRIYQRDEKNLRRLDTLMEKLPS
ncbi:MAG: Predicted 2-oxoglutarate- and Fe(II)-dependent dioxygenase YbiX [Candidatus Kentron sp. G]|nr:MAG: Predicted 2-oxoglutarate- and Fe(II)-dependent dioxygenase YbiX [Candidatus Kentron sp. G]VFN01816.1 MAG: Predicted 2-oxoglutarate- and Fe(II)-dependent dioxygenase YbiX [Candidatus Kentron sp. G]VFN01820.1 MAG: Predicted 2-oxoglutarate- and Fe(II)-dependent dioxygenase YbiX [Candidatus Kentron sp. G]